MNRLITVVSLFLGVLMISCNSARRSEIYSPDADVKVRLNLDEGVPFYRVYYKDQLVIGKSRLGLQFKNLDNLDREIIAVDCDTIMHREQWKPVWGQTSSIRNDYNEVVWTLRNEARLEMKVHFRVFDDGIAFRYVMPNNSLVDSVLVSKELSQFNIKGNPDSWSIPANFDTYEMLYRHKRLSQVKNANTPITMKREDGVYLSIHEANLTNYAGMTLDNLGGNNILESNLVPWPDGVKVRLKAGLVSPWRTVQIASKAGDLITSNMILNLNEPSRINTTDWIKPMKYVGVWWGMHIGTEVWTEGERHGATTENSKRYIDFAHEHGFKGFLPEGWNKGWDKWGQRGAFDQITPAKDFNLLEVAQYAKEKGVGFIGHHETGGDIPTYEKNMDAAFKLLGDVGAVGVKTGYAGGIYPRGQHHHGQFMVNHYRRVVKTAAKYHLMVDAHEPIKATGIARTWPNMMTREGVRGQEWNGWSKGNPPSHYATIPFTRMLGGPIDYTPGIFDLLIKNKKDQRVKWNCDDLSITRVHTTLAKQLANYVVLFSPWQMVADLPENMEGNPALKFIEDVPTTWDETLVPIAEIGEHVVIARRRGNNWFVGGLTDEKPRDSKLALNFLDGNRKYYATIYKDSKDTDFDTAPERIAIETKEVSTHDVLNIHMVKGGGFAIKIVPLN
ncbi:glycoside hydrolase family 97 protein [Halosquirtibacter xylanolyticus]|uniref:glycoside hydrolase family 97 protein n=1 Tax=Halosquirtibacter xylanolyticus TaxID=3374599 RepID=UPI0037499D81|nr:glycoside hydrolase family 97 protein [Prolixibacteraceae bacterium]